MDSSGGSDPDEEEGVRLGQQRGQVVLDAERLAHVLPHPAAVLLHPLQPLLPLHAGDVPQGQNQLLDLQLQLRAQPSHVGLVLLQRVLEPVGTGGGLVTYDPGSALLSPGVTGPHLLQGRSTHNMTGN